MYERREFRVVIKYYFVKGKTLQETKILLYKNYGESVPSISKVYK